MAKPAKDPGNIELQRILREMLDKNIDITARAVAQRHPDLKHPSDITRIADRRSLLEEWQNKQDSIRKENPQIAKRSNLEIARLLSAQELSIEELRAQRDALVESHIQMFRVVASLGGTRKMREFYESYSKVLEQLEKAKAFPEGKNVTTIHHKKES